jgi:hypothetical protein
MPALQRVSIGFRGGQVLALRMTEAALTSLQQALGREGWQEVEHDEGAARVDLSNVVYVQVDAAEPRVGFGA